DQVAAAMAVLVDHGALAKLRQQERAIDVDVVLEVAPDLAGAVRDAVRVGRRTAVEQQARAFERPAGHDHSLGENLAVLARRLVHVGDAAGAARLTVDEHVARHRAGQQREAASRLRLRQQVVDRGELRVGLAAVAAAAAEVALLLAPVGDRQIRRALRNIGNAELAASADDGPVAAAEGRRRKELAVRRVLDAVLVAANADLFLDFVVVRLEVPVGDRPVDAVAVAAAALEVPLVQAPRYAAPEERPASDGAGADPPEELVLLPGVG